MNNRIDVKFKELRCKKKKAFIAFITAGDPSLQETEKLVLGLEKAGVDIVELGVPFSDPLADGPTIQAASYRALKKGVTPKKILEAVSRIRKKTEIPIALMTYYNPIFRFAEKRFVKEAKRHGVDGLIIPDLPPEEGAGLIKAAKAENLATIFFLSPTTSQKRMKHIIKVSSGFIYYVSLAGVTGARKTLPKTIRNGVCAAKRMTDKPVCVGFGVSTHAQVKAISKFADGVIVGSAIVSKIAQYVKQKNMISKVEQFTRKLING